MSRISFSDHTLLNLYQSCDENIQYAPLEKLHYIEFNSSTFGIDINNNSNNSQNDDGPDKHLIVLLHGSFQTCHTFDDFIEEFYKYQEEKKQPIESFRFVSVDLRGHGDSSHTPNRYDMEGFVTDLILFLVKYWNNGSEKFDSVSFIGMSLGGIILMNTLLTDRKSTVSLSGLDTNVLQTFQTILKNHLYSISLIDISPDQIPVHNSQIPQGTQSVSQQVKATQTFNSFEEFLSWAQKYNPRRSVENLTTRLKYSLKCDTETNLWTWKYDPTFSIDTLARRSDMNLREELWNSLERNAKESELPIRISIVRGAESSVTTKEQLEKLYTILSTSKHFHCNYVEISKAGHSVLGDNPKEYIENYYGSLFIPQKRSKH